MATGDMGGRAADSLTYHDGMVLPSGVLSTRAPIDSFTVGWYSRQLAALGEARLGASCATSEEVYRFLWLRTFHHPVAIRVYSSREAAVAVTSETDGAGGYEPGRLIRRDSTPLSSDQWRTLLATIEEERFWFVPAIDSTRAGLDGSEWILEGCRGGRYQLVARWSPETTGPTSFMRRLGVAMLRLGQLEVPRTELY